MGRAINKENSYVRSHQNQRGADVMARGGKREGAGAPRKDPALVKKMITTRLPVWLVDWVGAQDNQATTIEAALIKTYRLKPPAKK